MQYEISPHNQVTGCDEYVMYLEQAIKVPALSMIPQLSQHKDKRRRTRASINSHTGSHLGVIQNSPGRSGNTLAIPDRSQRNSSIVTLGEENDDRGL